MKGNVFEVTHVMKIALRGTTRSGGGKEKNNALLYYYYRRILFHLLCSVYCNRTLKVKKK